MFVTGTELTKWPIENLKFEDMHNQELVNEINSLKETIESLISEIQYLRNDLEKTRKENEGLKFRMSELENALDGN